MTALLMKVLNRATITRGGKCVITRNEDGQQFFDRVHGVDKHHTMLLMRELLLPLIYHLCHLCHTWKKGQIKKNETIRCIVK